jgi:hypothetical protein
MEAIQTSSGYVVRLDRGEEVISALTAFVQGEEIAGAAIQGLGTLHHAVLGYFDRQRQEYLKREFPEDMELLSLVGNLTWLEGAPFIHAHAVLSGSDFVARGGHLFSAEIAATGEFLIWTTARRIARHPDSGTGLKLMAF